MTYQALAVQAAIETLQGTLQVAAALVRAGREVDLDGLQKECAALCTAIGVLPQEVARPLRPSLEALLLDLDRIRVALDLAQE